MDTLIVKLTSRKFLLALSTALLIVLNEGLGLGIDPEAYKWIVSVVIAYVSAEGLKDAIEAR